MKLKITILSILLFLPLAAFAAKPIDEAKAAYNNGDYDSAVAQLRSILRRTPKDGTANYYLGMSCLALGDTREATEALLKAESRGVAAASKELAELALQQYRTDDAEEHLDSWASAMRKSKKQTPDDFNEMTSRLVMLKNMLERVERIEIIDSVTVDAADFFTRYPLSPEAGRLLPASALPPQYFRDGTRMVYRPQNGREVIWAMPDSTGVYTLVAAGILDDGTMEAPSVIEGNPGEGGDADFPFLMPDGVTLYFANNGENSLGGYDIFMTRRNDDGSLLQPQNMGMPYNSPANDYMLAIDETTGLGWWATDRNAPEGKVTVYTFIPSETRNNYDPDDPETADRARITSIAATQVPGKDYQALLASASEAASRQGDTDAPQSSDFVFSLGDGTVITSASQLKDIKAREALKQWLHTRDTIRRTQAQLSALRSSLKSGNRSARSEILRLERTLPKLRTELRANANRVVRLARHIR